MLPTRDDEAEIGMGGAGGGAATPDLDAMERQLPDYDYAYTSDAASVRSVDGLTSPRRTQYPPEMLEPDASTALLGGARRSKWALSPTVAGAMEHIWRVLSASVTVGGIKVSGHVRT
jgi:hypothetical protein